MPAPSPRTRGYGKFTGPVASTTDAGVTRFATPAETAAGTSSTIAVTPLGGASSYAPIFNPLRPTAALVETGPRQYLSTANSGVLSSGRLSLFAIGLPAGLSINTIAFLSRTTPGAAMTNQWFALFDSSGNKLAVTADDTSTAWPGDTLKTLTITGNPFVTTYAGLHYLGICVVGTVPTLSGKADANSAGMTLASAIALTGNSSLTNPASCPNPFTPGATLSNFVYAYVG